MTKNIAQAVALAADCDVSDDAQIEAMVKQTVDQFGRDVAYNNSGIRNELAEAATKSVRLRPGDWS